MRRSWLYLATRSPLSAGQISAPNPQRLGKARRADRRDHEFLEIDAAAGVRTPFMMAKHAASL